MCDKNLCCETGNTVVVGKASAANNDIIGVIFDLVGDYRISRIRVRRVTCSCSDYVVELEVVDGQPGKTRAALRRETSAPDSCSIYIC